MLRRLRHMIGECLRFCLYTKYRVMGIKIGKQTFISMGAWLDQRRGELIIGDGCEITSGVKLLTHDATAKRIRGDNGAYTTIIGDHVFIGVNSVVLPGVKIGDNSIIGAGSVVTRNVSPNTLVFGNPAAPKKQFDEKTRQWIAIQSNDKGS